MNDRQSVRSAGWVGFAGAAFFLLSIVALQVFQTDIVWTTHYVSDFVHGPGGWLFVVATAAHGIGNLALAFGVGRSLGTSASSAAPALLGLSAIGVLVAAVFPTDPAGFSVTWIGFVHGAAVTASFFLEFAALFLFAMTFGRSDVWRPHTRPSFVLAILATIGLTIFVVLRGLDQLQSLGERAALVSFMIWELWASFRLIRSGRSDSWFGTSGRPDPATSEGQQRAARTAGSTADGHRHVAEQSDS